MMKAASSIACATPDRCEALTQKPSALVLLTAFQLRWRALLSFRVRNVEAFDHLCLPLRSGAVRVICVNCVDVRL